MSTDKILVTNIQRFSLHDGPGIRTTIFLKGCSLRCPWCSNPENLTPMPQGYVKDDTTGIYGMYIAAEELCEQALKDVIYYKGALTKDQWMISVSEDLEKLPGGVTFSGGECLLQMGKLVPVCKKLHDEGVHLTVETCLFTSNHLLDLALEHIDLFYVDIKIMDESRCREIELGDINIFKRNMRKLVEWTDHQGRHKPIVIRIPVIGNYTDDKTNQEAVKAELEKYKDSILKIEMIKEHNLGESKYISLAMEPDYHGVSDATMIEYREGLLNLGVPVEICKI